MRSCVAAPVAVIYPLALAECLICCASAVSTQASSLRCTRCRLLRCRSCKAAHLVRVAAVLVVSIHNPCDSICTTNYQLPNCALRKAPSFKTRAEGRKSKPKRGVYCVMPMAPFALALPPARPRKFLGANNVQRCTGVFGGCLDGCLDGFLGWWMPWLVGDLAGGCLGWWVPWLVGALAGGCLGWWVPWWGC
jgi:hypothetical protein